MEPSSTTQPVAWPTLAWLSFFVAGFVAPVAVLLMSTSTASSTPSEIAGSPVVALAMMGAGMIGAAIIGRFWIGVAFALAAGASIMSGAYGLGTIGLSDIPATGLAALIASISFAARGSLFARSAADKGWLIAVFVVAGEAAILITALARPDALPAWLLTLLPAQWANMALDATLGGQSATAAMAALIALAGTAAATLLVARLWPRRWPYLIMFSTWLALSALVYHQWPVS